MKDGTKISEAEWSVMKVFWSKSPVTANDVVEALSEKTEWKPKTIRTLINRLAAKRALGFDKDGRVYHYYPLLSESECIKAETLSFLDKAGPGALKPMLAAFIQEQELTQAEISELKQILEQKGGQSK